MERTVEKSRPSRIREVPAGVTNPEGGIGVSVFRPPVRRESAGGGTLKRLAPTNYRANFLKFLTARRSSNAIRIQIQFRANHSKICTSQTETT